MSQSWDVVGEDDVEGDVMGDVMGYDGGASVVGYDDEGRPIVVGARRRGRAAGPTVRLTKPGWRKSTLAPGVVAPDQGLEPLPMGSFTYALAAQTNTFQGQIQRPFRGERWLVSVIRTGASAVGRIRGQIFVGADLAQLDVAPVDMELLGQANAFGVRLTMKPAQPGVFIRVVTALSVPLAGADTISVEMMLLGRDIR